MLERPAPHATLPLTAPCPFCAFAARWASRERFPGPLHRQARPAASAEQPSECGASEAAGRARAAAWRGWRQRRRRRAVGWAAGAAMPVPRPGKTRAPPPIKSCRGATLASVRLVLSQEGAIVCSRSVRPSTCAENFGVVEADAIE